MAAFIASFAVNLIATLNADPTCSRGLCDADLFGPFKLATIWLPMAVATLVVLLAAWLVRPRKAKRDRDQ